MARFRLDNWKRWRGNCYEAAFKYQQEHPEVLLVHGTPRGRGPENKGQRFGHAWCEAAGPVPVVYDLTVPHGLHGVHPLVYYALGDIEPTAHCVRYTREQACIWALKTGHYGPWQGPAAASGLHSQRERKRRRKAGKSTPV